MNESGIDRDIRLLRRVPILAACRDGPADRSTIADRADCSGTTVYRATTDLVDDGLLEERSGGYSLTNFGTTMLDSLAQLRTDLDGARHLKPLLDRIDAPELHENVGLFADANVVEASPDAPYALEQHLASIIRANTGQWFGFTRSFGPPSIVEITDQALEDGASAEWVFTRDATEAIGQQYPEIREKTRAFDRTTIYHIDDLPFDFAVYDDTLVLIAADADTGVHVATATTDDPDAVAWARDVFETYRDDAELVA